MTPRASTHTAHAAAQRLLSNGGADAVTIRGMAARGDVAPNAVYTYFPDKAAGAPRLGGNGSSAR